MEFCESLWLLGDNFLARTYRDGVKSREPEELFMTTHFNVEPVGTSKFTSNNTNMLSRICNSLAKALNDNETKPLLQYIVVILDEDLMEFLGYDLAGFAEMIGEWISYLTTAFKKMIHDRKSKLPRGSV